MKACPFCGERVQPMSTTCGRCGVLVERTAAPREPSHHSRFGTALILGLGIGLLVFLAVLLVP